ncbi:ribonuclease P protein component [Rhodococcus sp. BP-349]|uniref:ribonuclease P protein component n=1 Tax=unclassified Rhodococcus (in: high G+C Gram-positive bacteria) TaxID=192944 RepID=UPI001C9AD5B5|nr:MULTISPECIES: ribonuclease P protein component [unclassified Rhodococcus (in: high G+C Gram-positive bacteria)]MBY6539178.1 ribonuclease P protein component [Rhodococcus sp. BP-363]MBY6544494.1 ribonuclease P protein component [Rhodococcus sp. BP-369]MBY6563724.1 ribonuclease P protein component [Rhodococcus sp. BP-370]MBY6578016.1 ribonuclease P protein component [Rhodococcus sp. BP-364]MBY6587317.1 ribonuclease P protein component [Rhodococcus sp. BP-358]
MLPEQHRLHQSSDFQTTVRRGRRTGRHDIVVHLRFREDENALVSSGHPRFGLVVSKAVGPAVTRHRVARRLRHICSSMLPLVESDVDVVVRALPGAATAASSELERQLASGLRRLGAMRAMNSSHPVPAERPRALGRSET